MTLVIDSSAIVALALQDEDATYAEAVLRQIATDRALAPMLFWYELRNVLLQAEKRSRISKTDVDSFLNDFNTLAIGFDSSPNETVVMELARKHKLTSYDASYLELAMRSNSTIATLDERMKTAAIDETVPVFAVS